MSALVESVCRFFVMSAVQISTSGIEQGILRLYSLLNQTYLAGKMVTNVDDRQQQRDTSEALQEHDDLVKDHGGAKPTNIGVAVMSGDPSIACVIRNDRGSLEAPQDRSQVSR
jgi:hypothetical protein